MSQMPAPIHLLLPDRWRVELMRRPLARESWLSALESYPAVRLIDWASPRPGLSDLVIVAGLDLAGAELVLKLPSEVRIFAVHGAWVRFPIGGRARFVERAWHRVQRRLPSPHRSRRLPLAPGPYLTALLQAAGVAP